MAIKVRHRAAGLLVLSGLLLATALSPDWPRQTEMAAIRVYQRNASPWMGRWVQCRYDPTCSHYALQSLQEKGFWVGNLRIARRLALCSPVGMLIDGIRGA